MSSELTYWTAGEIADAVRAKRVSALEVMQATLARARVVQEARNPFVTICEEAALADARAADAALARGEAPGPLHGVPFHVKDLVNTKGVRTTFCSAIYEHNVPAADSVSVARLKAAGAVLMGKTTSPEFGHMCYTESPLFGRTANAWDASRTSGGSSGGAGVALAAGVAPIGVGTDAGGSTRIPAACNGVVGFKQSAGVVPHDMATEVFANVSSINPMGRTVLDTAMMLEAMAGDDASDPFACHMPATGFVEAVQARASLKGTRIAWRPYLGNTVIDREVLAACEKAAHVLADLGAIVEPMPDDAEPVEPMWFAYSAAMWNARFKDISQEWHGRLSPTLLAQMERGKDTSAEAVGRALLARTQFFRKVQAWFSRFDVILTPTLTRTAIPIEERLFEPIEIEGRPVDTVRRAWYPYTHPFNLTGHPALTLPAGFHSDGLPMAIQLVGRRAEDARLLAIAAHYEAAAPWSHRRPAI